MSNDIKKLNTAIFLASIVLAPVAVFAETPKIYFPPTQEEIEFRETYPTTFCERVVTAQYDVDVSAAGGSGNDQLDQRRIELAVKQKANIEDARKDCWDGLASETVYANYQAAAKAATDEFAQKVPESKVAVTSEASVAVRVGFWKSIVRWIKSIF